MIEESARVVAVEDGFALLETERKSACQSCAARKGCGTGALAKVVGRRFNRVRALNPIGARVGDCVVVGIAEEALVRGSLVLYLVPLLGMLGGAMAAEALLDGEGWTILGAIAGMAGAFLWARRHARRVAFDARYQPVILRPVGASESILHFER